MQGNIQSCYRVFLMLLSYFVLFISATKLNLFEPSIITWGNGKDNSTLIVYNFQTISNEQWSKVAETPSNFTIQNKKVSLSKEKAFFYSKKDIISQESITFFYKMPNNNTSQGILQGKSFYSNNSVQHLTNSHPLFRLDPQIPYETNPKEYIIFQAEGYQNMFYINKSSFSLEPTCNKLCPVNTQFIQSKIGNASCQVKSVVKSIMQQGFDYQKQVNGVLNSTQFLMSLDLSLSYDFFIDKSIIISNLKIQPLSKLKFDLKKVTINVHNFKYNGAQKITVKIQNKDESFVFIKIQCLQSGFTLFSKAILLASKQTQTTQVELSHTSPSSEITFKVTNPVTSQLYMFSTPSSIVSDVSSSTFYFQNSQFLKSEGLPQSAVIGIAVSAGVAIFIVIGGTIIYRRRKKVKKLVSLNLDQVKNSCPTNTASEREFVNSEILPPELPELIVNIPLKKRKPGTATTVATTKDSQRQQTQQKSSQPSTPPSIEERMNRRKQMQKQSFNFQQKNQMENEIDGQSIFDSCRKKNQKKYKPGHKRTSSAVQILMPNRNSQSEQHARPETIKSIQVLQNVNI